MKNSRQKLQKLDKNMKKSRKDLKTLYFFQKIK